MKYSVIIPVYNAAGTIGRCLDSLLSQPHEAAEILLINDGSADESAEICRRYAQAHGCIRYFEKENGGVSSARNLGLDMAAGEYILFVDSDDYVTPDYLSVIDKTIEQCHPDILLYGLQCFGARNDTWTTRDFVSEDQFEISRFVQGVVHDYLYSSMTIKGFRRMIIQEHHLRLDEALQIGEDQAFIFAYTMHIKRMASIENVLYHYEVENKDSLSQKRRDYLKDQLLRVNMLMQDALNHSGYSGPVRRIYQETVAWTHYRSVYSACKELIKYDMTAAERRVRIRRICEDFCRAGIAPAGVRVWLIALPVIGRMGWLIDGMSRFRAYRRKQIR